MNLESAKKKAAKINNIAELYFRGLSDREIAVKLNTDKWHVRQFRKRYGLPPNIARFGPVNMCSVLSAEECERVKTFVVLLERYYQERGRFDVGDFIDAWRAFYGTQVDLRGEGAG